MAFRVLTMAVDLCRLTTRTMNVNAGHERTSKARIIHQIQLIRGITNNFNTGQVVFRPIAGNVPSIALLMAWKKGEMKPALRDFIAIVQERLASVTA
ncbi:hypothetical protein SDY_2734 [Shigella dysenteriae Sd197]|uniref:Uncharacterized protein n=2 Tax=Shigella dysenteriae TaxID=622 RepID=Q32D27_SHIDS|nr:hypothetical protein SDY_2734 [Shigella dysenteriae Sd197]